MPNRHARSARLGSLALPAVALLGVALAGCSDPAPAEPSVPVPAPSSSAPPAPAPSEPARVAVDAGSGTTGSDGLTVRYLDGGTVKSVRVEDFPR